LESELELVEPHAHLVDIAVESLDRQMSLDSGWSRRAKSYVATIENMMFSRSLVLCTKVAASTRLTRVMPKSKSALHYQGTARVNCRFCVGG
jgi:hypothetical protein